jgi:hypothetical protein
LLFSPKTPLKTPLKTHKNTGTKQGLRWESLVEALAACALVRLQVSTRYCSTENQGLGEAAAESSRWRGKVAGEERRRVRMQQLRRRSMAAWRRKAGDFRRLGYAEEHR